MPESTPAATIIIPLLQQPDDWLEQCVGSALAQTQDVEVIVVRSARTPSSNRLLLERIQEKSPRLVVVEEEKPSFPGALNQGIRMASAQRIGFLLADDWLEATAVEECLAHDADIVSTGLTVFEGDGATQLPEISRAPKQEEFERRTTLQSKAQFLSHFFLFRRSKLLEVGLLDESVGDFPGIDDFHLIWSLLEAEATVRTVELQLYNKREHRGERLTLESSRQALANLSLILDRHGVRGRRKRRLLREHGRWFGRSTQDVYRALQESRFPRLRALLDRIVYGPPE